MLKLKKGYSIIEVLLSGVIFSLAVSSVVSIIIYTQKNDQIALEKDLAISMIEEGSLAIKSIRDENFFDLIVGDNMALSFINGEWSINATPTDSDDKQNQRTRRLSVTDVSPDIKKVSISVTYPVNSKGDTKEVSVTEDLINIKKESISDITMQSNSLNMVLDIMDLEESFNSSQ